MKVIHFFRLITIATITMNIFIWQSACIYAAGPTTQSARPQISPQAQAELDAIRAAYSKLRSIQCSGTFSGKLRADGQERPFHTAFDSTFLAGGKFKHMPKAANDGSADISFGCTGKFDYLLISGAKGAGYLTESSVMANGEIAESRGQLATTMWRMDPGLALCITSGDASSLSADARRIEVGADVMIDGSAYNAVIYDCPASQVVLLVDPKTHLLRRVSTMIPARAGATGMAAVSGSIICDYPKISINSTPIDQSFDWTPPAGAQQLLQPDDVTKMLKGQAAPDITFTCIDGTRVTLSSLKGHVVVLDFWATWCVPCVASLPNLNKLNEENQPRGLKMFALDAGEDLETVKKFMADKRMNMAVAIDDGVAAKAYSADALPQTVVIGKDGVVKNVFVGFSADSENLLRTAIREALSQP